MMCTRSNISQEPGTTPSRMRSTILAVYQAVSKPRCRPFSAHSISRALITGVPTAHRKTLERAQLDTISSQPTVGSAHSAYTGSSATMRSGVRYRSGDSSRAPNILVPCAISAMQPAARITSDITTAMPSVIRGATTTAISTFDSTVVRSDTGSDFQNSRLRSRRSSCRAPRQ